MHARLYGNIPLYNALGSNLPKLSGQNKGLPMDRPTFNIVQACVDTLVAKITQARPEPIFLTEAGDYKERRLAKQLNNFILGELYQTKAYDKAALAFRDAGIMGAGCLKIFETSDHKVGIDRVLKTELLIDPNDALYGTPTQLFQLKLVDRDVLIDQCPSYKSIINAAEGAYADNSAESARTISDQVMVVEAWHLPSGKDAKDGRHVLACTSGILIDSEYDKQTFPFVFMNYSSPIIGFWGTGVAQQLMGTQTEINSILYTISRSMELVGVPRVFVEEGSKVTSASFNSGIGTIVKFRGTKPSIEVSPVVPQELYAQLQRLIDYGFQQVGVSALQASSQKPAGLNSGEAIRSYNDISTDRMAYVDRQYSNIFIDLAYQITDLAKDIATEQGSYQTIYPNKDGTKEIDLPNVKMIQDPFVVQVYNQSSLPKDPAGRRQTVAEMISSGMITIKEGRRLLDYPDLEQVEKLANASEERIYKILDQIVEDGEYTPPDPFMDLELANEITTQYYNLYVAHNLEEDKAELLRTFFTAIQDLKQAAMPPAPLGMPGAAPGAPGAPTQGVPAPTVAPPPVQNGVNSQVG